MRGGVSIQVRPEAIVLDENVATETFNSNLDAVLQFMVDAGLRGCQWCTLHDHSNADVGLDHRRSTCMYEMTTQIENLCIMDADDSIAPLRIVSFDIEAAGRRGVFPQPEIDPVIQIALQFNALVGGLAPRPILLSLRQCDPIDGVDVLCFEDESKLLCAFRDIVVAFGTAPPPPYGGPAGALRVPYANRQHASQIPTYFPATMCADSISDTFKRGRMRWAFGAISTPWREPPPGCRSAKLNFSPPKWASSAASRSPSWVAPSSTC